MLPPSPSPHCRGGNQSVKKGQKEGRKNERLPNLRNQDKNQNTSTPS